MKLDTEKLFGTNAPPATDVRVRYSYDRTEQKPKPKNTLLSFTQNGRIFFGIARCNIDAGDRFNRKIGRSIASKRAVAALQHWEGELPAIVDDLNISGNMLWGHCPSEKAAKIVEHFKFVDDTIENRRQDRYAKRRKAA